MLDFEEVRTIDSKTLVLKGDYIALGLFRESKYETLKNYTQIKVKIMASYDQIAKNNWRYRISLGKT